MLSAVVVVGSVVRCFVGWIGVIIEHETGSVASANGVGTGSTIKTHAKAAYAAPKKKKRRRKIREKGRDNTLEKRAELWGGTHKHTHRDT